MTDAAALSSKVALVTGASSGIGEAAAVALSAAGAVVALSARRADRLADIAGRIEAHGGRAIVIPGDVTEEAVAEQAIAETVGRFGRLDILVNSAGIIQAGGVENANTPEWRRVMDVNFFGTLHCCKAAVPHMRAQGGGDIINISSTSGRRSAALFGAYAPSKHALNAMSEGLRQEVGGHGIRVCVIEPGATATEVAEAMSDPKFREAMRAHVHKDGAVMPADIAEAIVFVASLPPRANVSELLIRPTIDVAPL
jgi:NADP-dependent 3-hydroxy acid dehydrogenase YdfG